jgi:hypothetical protein
LALAEEPLGLEPVLLIAPVRSSAALKQLVRQQGNTLTLY